MKLEGVRQRWFARIRTIVADHGCRPWFAICIRVRWLPTIVRIRIRWLPTMVADHRSYKCYSIKRHCSNNLAFTTMISIQNKYLVLKYWKIKEYNCELSTMVQVSALLLTWAIYWYPLSSFTKTAILWLPSHKLAKCNQIIGKQRLKCRTINQPWHKHTVRLIQLGRYRRKKHTHVDIYFWDASRTAILL